MRNLNECQAEVFRRSEKRIKARKRRRNHILMACIPLVLCITLFSAFFLPGVLPKSPEDPGVPDGAVGGLTEQKYESLSSTITKITVAGSDFSQTYTDASDVRLILDQLFSYGTGGLKTNGTINDAAADDDPGSIAESANTGYRITLFINEEQKTEYYLAGNTLKNLTTNQTHTLSQKQVNELKDLLGIPAVMCIS